MMPKDVHILISGICGYYLMWQKDFVAVIKLRILIWEDYPELPGWSQGNHKGPYKREAGD